MVDFAIGLWGTPQWTNGDIPAIIRSVQTAEACGIDCFDAGDHLAFHREAMADYPFPGGRLSDPDEPFLEPLIMLAGLATATTRIRLVTSILLAPLRPALLLAKQAATLDVLSNGRLDLGVGVGWQKQEYEAAGASWENRFAYLDEEIRACRTLWSQAPASYRGKLISFDRLHARPFPRQPGGVPIWFGVQASPRSFRRLAELADGWMPMERDPEVLAAQIIEMRRVAAAHGRDPASIKIRARPPVLRDSNGKGDLEALLAQIPAFIAAGADSLGFSPFAYCDGPDDFERVIRRLAAAK
jgi:probable F420-dependent oxidoreductase